MSMIHCKECGAEVSKSAKVCPKCGKKLKHSGFRIVIGIIFILTGGSCWMYGDSLNNDYETQIRSVWNEGKTNPGSIFVIIGIIVVIIGAILILCGIFYKITAPNKKSNQITPIICPFCKQSNSSLNSFMKEEYYYEQDKKSS